MVCQIVFPTESFYDIKHLVRLVSRTLRKETNGTKGYIGFSPLSVSYLQSQTEQKAEIDFPLPLFF